MNNEYESLLDAFRVHDDLDEAIEATISGGMVEACGRPLTQLSAGAGSPFADAEPRAKRVTSRVIERLLAA